MAWFSVTSTMRAPNGTNITFAFRPAASENIECLDDLADALCENGVVVGDRFRTSSARGGEKPYLYDGREIMLTREGVAMATDFHSAENLEIIERH